MKYNYAQTIAYRIVEMIGWPMSRDITAAVLQCLKDFDLDEDDHRMCVHIAGHLSDNWRKE